jgi:feruloyl-CoA synthase
VHQKIREGLALHNKAHPNVSARVARVLLQTFPPLADKGEITEKGYINQSRTQDLRRDQIDMLYAEAGELPANLIAL